MRPLHVALLLAITACGGTSDPRVGPDGPDAGMHVDTDAATTHPDGASCIPTTCFAHNAMCGTLDDGCGHELDCGYCEYASDACQGNTCVCQPNCYMSECGDDGCGGTCGTCDSNESCSSYKKCIYQGEHTAPPPTWVCSPSSYDAGDGCDCNCGAVDPDCGEAGLALHGCTGLDAPTCTAQAVCTGGGACHSVPGSAYLTHYETIGTAPTMNGGTVLSGRYEGSDMHSYNPPGGLSGYGGGDGIAIEITGTTWKRMRRPVGGYDPVDETFTASVSGHTVTLTRTCPVGATETYTFTATATQLILSQPNEGGTEVVTYTKLW
jgi:hypothetical protein